MTLDKEMPLYLIGYEPPENQNFIAIYGDGSGASLFCWCDNGKIVDGEGDIAFEAEGLQDALQDAGFCSWIPLPDNFEFFFMQGLQS